MLHVLLKQFFPNIACSFSSITLTMSFITPCTRRWVSAWHHENIEKYQAQSTYRYRSHDRVGLKKVFLNSITISKFYCFLLEKIVKKMALPLPGKMKEENADIL